VGRTLKTAFTLAALVLVMCPVGCDRAKTSAVSDAPSTRSFVLDEHVRYVYRDPIKGLRHAAHLDNIPLEQRAATILYTDDEPSNKPANVQGAYVANLLEADPEDTVEAKQMTLRAHFQHARAAERGAWLARMVLLAARDQTQLDRRSERSAASRKAKKLLEQIVPRETQAGTNQLDQNQQEAAQ
jgi:hypothetical protein